MKRQKDQTPHTCKLCEQVLPASGMPSHLYHKHNKTSSNEYVEKFGEFRQKYLKKAKKIKKQGKICKECGEKVISHKSLIHHINKKHQGWEAYFIKHFFKGKHPLCECGCGTKVKLLRHGKDEKGNTAYARRFISGHDTKTRLPGYRKNNREQKDRMRLAAIKRLKREGKYYPSNRSTIEKELEDFIQSLNIQYVLNDRTVLAGQEIDILLPQYKIGIEYNGSRFHSDLFKDKRYHLNKTKECMDKSYRLIHIWEPDWYHKSDIIKSMLSNIVGKSPNILYARNTKVKEISHQQAKSFLEQNHLQGNSVSKIRLGLFKDDLLVSVMTFSNLRRATGNKAKEGSYELIRYCNLLDYTVVGGASKLFTHFLKHYKPQYIISYANRDWSIGNLYNKLGMTFIKYTPPGYFYTKSRYKFSRFQFQKHKLVEQGKDPDKTEYEIMTEDGYYRIWDCGNYLYEWSNS